MTDPTEGIELSRCEACLARFLPSDGPCPRCGASRVVAFDVPGSGTILAATELMVPPPGVPAPHRLAIVEVADAVRLLAVVDGPLPRVGSRVGVRKDGDRYRASAEATAVG